jgi:hypothetical protein
VQTFSSIFLIFFANSLKKAFIPIFTIYKGPDFGVQKVHNRPYRPYRAGFANATGQPPTAGRRVKSRDGVEIFFFLLIFAENNSI